MVVLIGNKPSMEKEFLKSTARKSKFGTSLEVLPFGPFGWKVMINCSITNNGMKQGLTPHLGRAHSLWKGGLGQGAQTNQDLPIDDYNGYAPRV